MARNKPGSQTPPRNPMTRKLATLKTATCNVANNNPATYSVKKSRRRLIGFETYKSIAPLLIRSGKMPAVEIRARIDANQESQTPMPIFTNIDL